MSKNETTWVCTSCGNRITTLVTLSEPPVCHNKHLRGGKVMKKEHEIRSEREEYASE